MYQGTLSNLGHCVEPLLKESNFYLAELCYTCGDVEASTFVDQARCNIPAAGTNSTDTDAELQPCTSGICYVSWCSMFFCFYNYLKVSHI